MLREIHLVLHTHTDIGFTHDQAIVRDLHGRFIEEALDMIEADAHGGVDEAAAFKWTCEAWLPVWQWWQQTDERNRGRLRQWEQAGRLEVTALPLHLAPLYDLALHGRIQDQMHAFSRETGCRLRSAMNCDVNGQHWFLSDLLLDAGVEGYSTAINTHFGHCPLQRPALFRWRTPSARTLPAYIGMVYGFANRFLDPSGIKQEQLRVELLPRLQAHLEAVGWTLPVFMVQGVHAFGDNGSAPRGFRESVEHWNARAGDGPRLRISTMAQWWQAVAPYLGEVPIIAGDWTDSWNFGAGSAAREMAVAKRAQARLHAGDVLHALLPPGNPRLQLSRKRYRQAADDALLHWVEHTWGADCGVGEPFGEDTDTMWNHKANYAYSARSLAHLLRRDSMAALAQAIEPTMVDGDLAGEQLFVIFNPLPFRRVLSGMLPSTISPHPRGGHGDPTAGSLYTERRPDWDPLSNVDMSGAWLDQLPQYILPPMELDGWSYRTLRVRDMVKASDAARVHQTLQLDNGCLRVAIDERRGGLASLRLHDDDCEWVDSSSPWTFGGYVRETIDATSAPPTRQTIFHMDWSSPELVSPDGWNPGWPAMRQAAAPCRASKVVELPDGYHVMQLLDHPCGSGEVTVKWFLPHAQPWLDVVVSWIQGLETEPAGDYVTLPFAIPGARARVDLGGLHIDPQASQLPGVTNDFFTAGRWVDFNGGDRGVTIALPENPLCQLGGFRFGRQAASFELEQALFLGWVANNYWDTNFRAHQPGKVCARYRIYPYKGVFNADAAHTRGEDATQQQLQVHPLDCNARPEACLPPQGTFLRLLDAAGGAEVNTVRVVDFIECAGGKRVLRLFNDAEEGRGIRLVGELCKLPESMVVQCPPRRMVEVALG